MAYKSRGNYPVKVDICKKCHKVRAYCSCKKEIKLGSIVVVGLTILFLNLIK